MAIPRTRRTQYVAAILFAAVGCGGSSSAPSAIAATLTGRVTDPVGDTVIVPVLRDGVSLTPVGPFPPDLGRLYTLNISNTSELTEDGHFVFVVRRQRLALHQRRRADGEGLHDRSLKLSNTIRYLNVPVGGFMNTDAVTAIALVAKF